LKPKIAESDTVSLGHGLCGFGGSIYNKDNIQDKLYASLIALKMIDTATGLFEIFKATNNSATSTQDLSHDTWLARYP
jgi:hypothetical protein